jgi:hypothetical protein
VTDDDVRRLRLRAQGLDGALTVAAAGEPAVVETLRRLAGVQAQYADAAALAVRARATGPGGPTAADVETARVRARSVVRTWCQRGTLQLLASEDVDLVLPLVGPGFVRQGRGRLARLGLDERRAADAVAALGDLLASRGPSTRDEIVERLAARGIPLAGQARPHLLRRAALEGAICFGPDRDGEPTYVRLDDWLPARRRASRARPAALAELAGRYLAGHGPAGPEDMAAWSGLPLGEARAAFRAIGGDLIEVEAAGRRAWLPADRRGWLDEPARARPDDRPDRPPVVRLVSGYDPYLLDYRGRDLAVPSEHAGRVWPGGGLLHPTVLVDGLAAGTWRMRRRRGPVDVLVEPFGTLPDGARPALEREVADLGRFLGAETRLVAP